jgi:adenosine kinase
VRVSDVRHTARFVCTTDTEQCQIASFYPGAMSEAREIELGPVAERVGGLDLVLVGANDPEAMNRHTDECRFRGIPFVADPSQQLAWLDGDGIKQLVDGAAYLFSNDYEAGLIEQKTGWSHDEVLERVGVRVTTLGKDGARIEVKGEEPIEVGCPPEELKADPTGVGDAFRAGFLAGLAWDLSYERCAQIGSLLATYVIETVGTQEYDLAQRHFLSRFEATYGPDAEAEVAARVRCPRP